MRSHQQFLVSISVGYILFFYSERIFWAVIWPDTSSISLLLTWLAYSAVTYLFLCTITTFRASNASSLYLSGAMFGWLVEGGIASTLYGTEGSAPFPWSISITGLAWHTLISVMIGWWATGRAISSKSFWPMTGLQIATGCFWGVWGMFPRQETPPVLATWFSFGVQAIIWTIGLMLCWHYLTRVDLQAFRAGRIGTGISVMIVGVFYSQHAIALGWITLMLPLLLTGTLLILAIRRDQRSQLPQFDAFKSRHSVLFPLLPLSATVTYAIGISHGWDHWPIAATVYEVGGWMGFACLLIAALGCLKRPKHSPLALK